jgi:hypothetical protein
MQQDAESWHWWWHFSVTSIELLLNYTVLQSTLNTSLFYQLEQMFISNLMQCLNAVHSTPCKCISAKMFFLSQKYLLCLHECEETNPWQVQQISSLYITYLSCQYLPVPSFINIWTCHILRVYLLLVGWDQVVCTVATSGLLYQRV